MECTRFGQFDAKARCVDFEDAQQNASFWNHMHSPHSLAEVGYVTRRQDIRPSVIYFHGELNKKTSERKREIPNMGLEKRSEIDRGQRTSVTEHNDCEDVQQKVDLSDFNCYEPDDCRCRKRHRTSFSSFQLRRLEEEFDADNYIIGMKRWRLSEELEIPEKQIKIWFQNRRTKSKKYSSKDLHHVSE